MDRHGPARFYGQASLDPTAPGFAEPGDGAERTPGFARQADRGAEFHERLIEVAGPLAVEQRVGDRAQPGACIRPGEVAVIVRQARQYAQNVAINHRTWQIECDAGDGRRRVVADSGQCANGRVISSKAA